MGLLDHRTPGPPARSAGIELDSTARPQDDFHRYVNGRWVDAFTLPEHRAEVTVLALLADKVQNDLAAVIRGAAAEPRQAGDASGRQIADLYASFMDERRIEQDAAASLQADIAAIRSAPDRAALAHVMGQFQAQGVGGAAELSVSTDTAEASGYVLILSQAGLGLPGAALYRDPGQERLRERYAAHIRVMLTQAGLPDSAAPAADVLRLETDLAAGHEQPGAKGQGSARPVSCSVAQLAARCPGFPWSQWVLGLGQVPPGASVCVRYSAFLNALGRWWESHRLDELKTWLIWRYVHEMAPFGPSEVFAENFAFYGQVLTGSTRPRPRWMRGTSFVQTILGDAVGQRYLAEHLAPGTLDGAARLVDALVRSYRKRLERATWMRETTRASALQKLDSMVFEIGFPGNFEALKDLQVDPADLIGNVKRGRAWHIARQIGRLDAPVDRSDWKVHPQSVTAYYRHGLNQVVIPAALLQPPIFAPDGDMARNFALLGSIVCHEMSHAFDSRGSRYDGRGRVRDWWAPEDGTEFARRTALLMAQYDQYAPRGLPGRRVSGTRTLGENIADIAGLTVAQAAFADRLAAQRGQSAGGSADAAEIRRFFILWASMWRAKSTPGRLMEHLASDRHAPAEFRCNGALGHVEAFYDAFDVRQGDGLYISPAARFTLV
jgi:putative endopeptidase